MIHCGSKRFGQTGAAMADHTGKSWTKEQTGQFIKLRGENHHLFTGAKNSATVAWRTILEKMGQQGKVTPLQAKKKWDNIKRKYKIFTNITLIIDETGFEDREGLKRIVTSYNHKTSGSCYRVRESFDVLGQLVKKLSTLNAATHPTPVNSFVMDYIYKRCAEKLGKIHGQSVVIDFRAANSDPQGTGQVTFRARNKSYSPDRVHLDFVRQRFITFYQRTASDLHQKDLHLAPQQCEDLQRRFPLLLFNRGPSNTTKICGPFAHVHKLEEYVSQNFKSSANGPAKNVPASSQSFKSNAPSLKHSKPPEDESCPICMELIPPEKKKALQCKHSFCKDCLQKAFVYKPVCPICGEVYGTLEGTQPDGGTMDIKRTADSLPGYENHKTIVINYHIPNGIQKEEHPNPGQPFHGVSRTAYLPDSPEGRKVLELLSKAFKQRLIFTIGRSSTTGRNNMVTWNDIHHKTSMYGGPTCYGYPDPDYLNRVQEELKAKGIK